METINKYWKVILMVVTVIILVLFLKSCNDKNQLKKQLDYEKGRSEQNMHALTDTITIYKNKASEISYKKVIANMSKDELKVFNPSLYDDIKKEGGTVKTIIKTVIKYVDSGYVINSVSVLDSTKGDYSLGFNYVSEDSSLKINGKSSFSAFIVNGEKGYGISVTKGATTFDSTIVSFGLTTGIKKENGVDKIFITPSSSKVIISKIDGADVSDYIKNSQILKKRKNFSLNVSAGYGVMFTGGNNVMHGPSIQIGIGYNIINF